MSENYENFQNEDFLSNQLPNINGEENDNVKLYFPPSIKNKFIKFLLITIFIALLIISITLLIIFGFITYGLISSLIFRSIALIFIVTVVSLILVICETIVIIIQGNLDNIIFSFTLFNLMECLNIYYDKQFIHIFIVTQYLCTTIVNVFIICIDIILYILLGINIYLPQYQTYGFFVIFGCILTPILINILIRIIFCPIKLIISYLSAYIFTNDRPVIKHKKIDELELSNFVFII